MDENDAITAEAPRLPEWKVSGSASARPVRLQVGWSRIPRRNEIPLGPGVLDRQPVRAMCGPAATGWPAPDR